MEKEINVSLEDYTMEFFKKASVSKTISTISKIVILAVLPLLIIYFKYFDNFYTILSSSAFVGLLIIWVFSTRQYNHLSMKIKMNLWLLDMVKNPEQFHQIVQQKGIK